MSTKSISISKEEDTNTKNEEVDNTDTNTDTNFNNSSTNTRLNLSLPQYLINAFGDLYKEDGLLVLGRGLGLLPLLSSYIRFVADANSYYHYLDVENKETTSTASTEQPPSKKATENDKNNIKTPPLVFVLGLTDEIERNSILSQLESWGIPSRLLPTIITNESGSGKDRAVMYNRGGVFIITSRILIVDLLTFVANPINIDGILVAHAERVVETSTEAFIIRIYRTQRYYWSNMHNNNDNNNDNKSMGFVKAFTDDVVKLLDGFAKIDKILKSLYVRKMYLYPRFHMLISEELEINQPIVEQLHIHLSPLMKDIQNAIAAAVQTCIRELKNATKLIEWNDAESLTLDNFITKNFDYIIMKQLSYDWHRLKPSTKQLVSDLRTLRTLFTYLIQYDCISFYKLICNLKSLSSSSKYPSMWLLTPAAELLFRKAKERVYKISIPSKISITTNHTNTNNTTRRIGRIHPMLEENPKWKILNQILTEIKMEHNNNQKQHENKDDKIIGGAKVLVMVKDNRTLQSLRSYLIEGKDRTMTLRWLRYLEHFNDRSRSVLKSFSCNNDVNATSTDGIISEESRLLLEEESRSRHFLFGNNVDNVNWKKKRKNKLCQLELLRKKQKRVDEERKRGSDGGVDEMHQRSHVYEAVAGLEYELHDDNNDNTSTAVIKNGMKKDTMNIENKNNDDDNRHDQDEDEYSSSDADDEIPYAYKHYQIPFKVKKLDDMRIVMKTYGSIQGEETLFLEDLRPAYIVLYDVDSPFVRSIELYSSNSFHSVNSNDIHEDDDDDDDTNNNKNFYKILQQRLKVFFMVFEASVEEKTYLKSLEREKNAFKRLIQYKQNMPVVSLNMDNNGYNTTQEMQQSNHSAVSSYAGGTLPLSIDTRTGKGKQQLLKASEERRDIAVDVREFRSSLPSILHRNGMRIAPVTLSVGDFILSPVHCIERKSISDLFGSFISGRLYTQAESMCKYYKCPCLLIEFDPIKSFSLQNKADLSTDIRTDSVCSKMSLLIMHFPKLRILWSRGPHETVKIFKSLKMNHDEVNVDKAVEIGRNSTTEMSLFGPEQETNAVTANDTTNNESIISPEQNDVAKEMLLRLPGMNAANARKVMNVCSCIADIAKMSREELKQLLGPISGQRLFTFFRQTLD